MLYLNLLNRIFGPKDSLRREEIDAYKEGYSDAHKVEEKMLHSDFDNDAVEGWESTHVSVDDGMRNLDDKMQNWMKHGDNNVDSPIASLILIGITAAVLILFTWKGNEIYQQQNKVEIAEHATSPDNTEDIKTEKTVALPTDKQITAEKLVENEQQKKTGSTSITESAEEIEKMKDLSAEETNEDIDLPIQSREKIPSSANNNQLVYHQAKEIMIHDLKNVDYRAYRNQPIEKRSVELTGTPANQPGEESIHREKEFSTSEKTTDIPYIDYLTETTGLFSKGKYKKALGRYLIILETYPQDVNANFYGGLCYYNLGQFEEAIHHLKNAYSVGYGNFREESIWYIAKANLEQDKELKAKFWLKRIIKEKGFYSQQAKELLNQLENN